MTEEKIDMTYHFKSEDGWTKDLTMTVSNEDGVTATQVCELFEEFIQGAGFHLDSIEKYWN